MQTFPESPLTINPRFPVFTKHNRYLPKFIDINRPLEVKSVGINPKGTIYFIVHGYIDTGDKPWIQDMMNALLDHDRYGKSSVVVVDWGRGSRPPYTQAVANIRLVGVMTAHIIHLIYEELHLRNLDNVHLIGHSLGAHLSGYAGHELSRGFGLNLGRITAMDPAEPLFTDTDPIVRLDRNDAQYVDVIHTDILPIIRGGLGMPKAIGHVDFYPNGGSNNPGCDESIDRFIIQMNNSFVDGMQQLLSCNHMRSYQYMTESILSKCPFMAVTCETYQDFREGRCFHCDGEDGSHCLKFGLESYQSYKALAGMSVMNSGNPIKAYLMTNARQPFCATHYKITIVTSGSVDSISHGGELGLIMVKIKSNTNSETKFMKFSDDHM